MTAIRGSSPDLDTGRLATRYRHAELNAESERRITKAMRESRSSSTVPHPNARFEFPDPADLRGIPCIAPGVGGTSPGTNPERITR